MSDKVEKAVEYMKGSYSCSQSILCAFAADAKLTEEQAKEIAEPYSGGRKIKCGALCAAAIVLEEKFHGEGSAGFIAELEREFFAKQGSLNCRELRAMKKSTCLERVRDAAVALDGLL